jgi:hypothetical protein
MPTSDRQVGQTSKQQIKYKFKRNRQAADRQNREKIPSVWRTNQTFNCFNSNRSPDHLLGIHWIREELSNGGTNREMLLRIFLCWPFPWILKNK